MEISILLIHLQFIHSEILVIVFLNFSFYPSFPSARETQKQKRRCSRAFRRKKRRQNRLRNRVGRRAIKINSIRALLKRGSIQFPTAIFATNDYSSLMRHTDGFRFLYLYIYVWRVTSRAFEKKQSLIPSPQPTSGPGRVGVKLY